MWFKRKQAKKGGIFTDYVLNSLNTKNKEKFLAIYDLIANCLTSK
jgi:hypothetical protein